MAQGTARKVGAGRRLLSKIGGHLVRARVQPHIYRVAGQYGEFDIFTLGADNAAGGTRENADVGSW